MASRHQHPAALRRSTGFRLAVGAMLLTFFPGSTHAEETDAPPVLEQILSNAKSIRDLAFADLVRAATGKKVLPFDGENPVHIRMKKALSAACSQVLTEANARGSAFNDVARINEVSRLFEDRLQEILNASKGMECSAPPTVAGNSLRSGYPDLRLTDKESGAVFYLDPKIHASGSDTSSFRTFYYEPDTETGKITEDAVHLLIGIEHSGESEAPWKFVQFRIVDLSGLKVRLKAEFQASNREIYQPEAILESGIPSRSKSAGPAKR